MPSVGKMFEQDFRNSFKDAIKDTAISIDRVRDDQGGFRGVRSFCDFMVYFHPYQYYLELKHVYGERFPIANISPNQIKGLTDKARIFGVRAGLLVQFETAELCEQYFMPIDDFVFLQDAGNKSVSRELFKEMGQPMMGTLKRTRRSFAVLEFFQRLNRELF